jgi:hypothetical protein
MNLLIANPLEKKEIWERNKKGGHPGDGGTTDE